MTVHSNAKEYQSVAVYSIRFFSWSAINFLWKVFIIPIDLHNFFTSFFCLGWTMDERIRIDLACAKERKQMALHKWSDFLLEEEPWEPKKAKRQLANQPQPSIEPFNSIVFCPTFISDNSSPAPMANNEQWLSMASNRKLFPINYCDSFRNHIHSTKFTYMYTIFSCVVVLRQSSLWNNSFVISEPFFLVLLFAFITLLWNRAISEQ